MESPVEGTIRIIAAPSEAASLSDWLSHERALRGTVSYGSEETPTQTLGAVEDIILHVVSPGAMGAIFGSLSVWLTQQRSDVEITLKSGDTEATLSAKRVKDTPGLVDRVQDAFESAAQRSNRSASSPRES